MNSTNQYLSGIVGILIIEIRIILNKLEVIAKESQANTKPYQRKNIKFFFINIKRIFCKSLKYILNPNTRFGNSHMAY